MARARIVQGSTIAALVLSAADAIAEPTARSSPDPQVGALYPVTDDDDPHDDFAAFPLVVQHDKHYVRAGLEVGGVVIVGFVDYLLNTAARGGITREGDRQWALRYDWEDLRGKLVGTAYELDANRFNTNYISHPFAGTMYYQAARSNHLSFAEAWIYAVAGSSVWEYFGEIRERVSVNDMIATPGGGVAIGEATLQMAGFFDRGKNNVPNRVLSALFGPVKALNDVFDGTEPLRTKRPDALGFATEPWHRFEVFAGAGPTVQSASSGSPTASRATYADVRFGLDMQVKNLPGYAGAARHARLFDDGNVASISFDAAISRGDLVQATFATRVVPIGYYYREASVDARGNVDGTGALVGLRIGYEYGVHDYDRDRYRGRPRDLVSLVSPVGIAGEYTFERAGLRLTTALDIAGSLAGVSPYALADYMRGRPIDGLPTATRNNGYYHAYAITALPSVTLDYGALELGASLRLDAFHAIEGLDEAGVDPALASIDDRRSTVRTAIGWKPRSLPYHLTLAGQRTVRAGDLGPVHASRTESSLVGSLGLVF